MENTQNLGLKLLTPTDKFDEADFNDNFQRIDDAFGNLSGGSAPTAAALSAEALTATVCVATKVDDTDYVTEG